MACRQFLEPEMAFQYVLPAPPSTLSHPNNLSFNQTTTSFVSVTSFATLSFSKNSIHLVEEMLMSSCLRKEMGKRHKPLRYSCMESRSELQLLGGMTGILRGRKWYEDLRVEHGLELQGRRRDASKLSRTRRQPQRTRHFYESMLED